MHLVSAFQNLVSNAVKYRAERTLEISIEAERCGADWVVRVADNGQGIAPENWARVFMPFVRLANRTVPGCGLGLAVCKKIIEELAAQSGLNPQVKKDRLSVLRSPQRAQTRLARSLMAKLSSGRPKSKREGRGCASP